MHEEAGSTTAEARPHGGRLLAARRRFPQAPEPFFDLSTGINPVAYPIPALPDGAFARLPEPEELAGLLHAAANAYGAGSPAMVAAAPGTQILINLLPKLLPQPRVTVLGPTYSEHAAAWRAAGSVVREVGQFEEIGTDAVVLCNPNNPDGRRFAPETLLELSRRFPLLVVDEAFADFEPGVSLAPFLPQPGLVVLRSFGKAYGLAGLRLGFALAAPDFAARIREALGPWPVSGPAIAIGREALADRAWAEAAAMRLQADAARLDRWMERAGLRVGAGTTLFRLGEGEGAPALAARLGAAGILVRSFAERARWLRFGIPGSPEAWARLDGAV